MAILAARRFTRRCEISSVTESDIRPTLSCEPRAASAIASTERAWLEPQGNAAPSAFAFARFSEFSDEMDGSIESSALRVNGRSNRKHRRAHAGREKRPVRPGPRRSAGRRET